jgi:hypothetical protein
MSSPKSTKDGALNPLARNKVMSLSSSLKTSAIHLNPLLDLQLQATWSKSQWVARIKESAERERVHISQVINTKKEREQQYITELENMIARKEVKENV